MVARPTTGPRARRLGTLQRSEHLDRRGAGETLHLGEGQQGLDTPGVAIDHRLDAPDGHLGTALGQIEPRQADRGGEIGGLLRECLLERCTRSRNVARGQHQPATKIVHERIVRLLALEFGLCGERLFRVAPAQMPDDEG